MKVDRSVRLKDHPTVLAMRSRGAVSGYASGAVDRDWIRQVCREAGADDVGLVSLEDPAVVEERDYVLEALPRTQTLIALCMRLNRDNMRSPPRSVAQAEYNFAGEGLDVVARRICRELEDRGIRAVYPPTFPMEVQRFPARMWIVSHKKVAVAAGLGRIGKHHNLIHPRFGTFIVLGTILMQVPVTGHDRPRDANPCIGCDLCVQVCPTGALRTDGRFDFLSCSTHTARESLSGFRDWVEQIAESKDAEDYMRRVPDRESASMWQNLAYKSTLKCGYCVAVCPAGDDVIGQYLAGPEQFGVDVVRPLQNRSEEIYVLAGSAADDHVHAHFPNKVSRPVTSTPRPEVAPVDGAPGAQTAAHGAADNDSKEKP